MTYSSSSSSVGVPDLPVPDLWEDAVGDAPRAGVGIGGAEVAEGPVDMLVLRR